MRQRNIDPKRFILLAHSEGTIHVARLIGQKLIDPKSLLLLGAVIESPKGILHWQLVDRTVNGIMKYDLNKNAVIDPSERTKICSDANFGESECDQKLPKELTLTAKYLFEISEKSYQENIKDVLQQPDHKPYANAQTPMASYAWWKMWFSNDKPVIEDLFSFGGKMSFLNGDIDTQTPGKRELKFVSEKINLFKVNPHAEVLPNTGHGFGSDGTFGPMSDSNIEIIAHEIDSLLSDN